MVILSRYPKSNSEISTLKITIPPWTILPFHTHPVINSGIILEEVLS